MFHTCLFASAAGVAAAVSATTHTPRAGDHHHQVWSSTSNTPTAAISQELALGRFFNSASVFQSFGGVRDEMKLRMLPLERCVLLVGFTFFSASPLYIGLMSPDDERSLREEAFAATKLSSRT